MLNVRASLDRYAIATLIQTFIVILWIVTLLMSFRELQREITFILPTFYLRWAREQSIAMLLHVFICNLDGGPSILWLIDCVGLSSHQHGWGYVGRPCYRHGIGCFWSFTWSPWQGITCDMKSSRQEMECDMKIHRSEHLLEQQQPIMIKSSINFLNTSPETSKYHISIKI